MMGIALVGWAEAAALRIVQNPKWRNFTSWADEQAARHEITRIIEKTYKQYSWRPVTDIPEGGFIENCQYLVATKDGGVWAALYMKWNRRKPGGWYVGDGEYMEITGVTHYQYIPDHPDMQVDIA